MVRACCSTSFWVGFWALGLGLLVFVSNGSAAGSNPAREMAEAPSIGRTGDELSGLVTRLASDTEGPGALRSAYDFFMKSMGRYDGDSATSIARAMHKRSFAMFDSGEAPSTVWSAFCLEGALRRGASGDQAGPRFREATAAIEALVRHKRTSRVDRLALVERYAIVAAGFGRRGIESATLGAALAAGGVDGAQITGLARLQSARTNGANDWETAAALFANLLDRAPQDPTGDPRQDAASGPRPLQVDPGAAPWALRGHGLAALGALRSMDSMPRTR